VPASAAVIDTLLQRSTGGPQVPGNALAVLLNAAENYPAWLDAIRAARRTIHLEMYIVHNDGIGRTFRDALIERANAGVTVRVLYDWFGSLRPSSFRFWAPLRAAGAEVRIANPPRLDLLAGLLSRDHRKLLAVDGAVAFISGLCIGDDWVGDPARHRPPWRDTGVRLEGPAVADAERAFAGSWRTWGTPLPDGGHAVPPEAGDVGLRVVATSPERTSLYRLELAMIGIARQRIWLTVAYFMGTSTFLEAMASAAAQGVDVRLLVPNNSDVPWVGNASRVLYRRLLEAGVRIFEWNGPMIHAKTAVADGRFVRIGSTNLNLSSWLGNWELDVVVDDAGVAARMEDVYLDDLGNATEVVITDEDRVRLDSPLTPADRRRRRGRRRLSRAVGGSANRVLKDVAMAGSMLGSAVRGYRELGPHERWALVFFAAMAAGVGVVAILWPGVVAWPVAVVGLWFGVSLLVRAWRVGRRGP
jgi:cardiolipin synthase